MEYRAKSPVAFIIFNRPDLTRQVFECIRKVKPAKLYIISDGARTPEEKTLVDQTRAVVEDIDWDCQVFKKYSDKNQGGKWGPYNGLSWVFEQENEAIILEDDNLARVSFFRYCDELLERYRDDNRIFTISGGNFMDPETRFKYSYWFSTINGLWGWATWRRSWKKIDMKITKWGELRNTDWLKAQIPDKQIREMYASKFDRVYFGKYGDKVGLGYAYTFAMMFDNALDIRPEKNLVSNVGFRPDANNTKKAEAWANFPTTELSWPLRHPPEIKSNVEWDIQVYRQLDPNLNHLKYTLKNIPFIGQIAAWGKKSLKRISRILSRIAKSFRIDSDYRFSIRDYFVYIFETLAHKKMRIENLGGGETHDRLRIRDFEFYWPKKQPRKELSALWQEVFNPPILDPHSYDFPEGQIKAGDVVIDAGACEGFFTHYALKRGATVHAFEPLPILKGGLEKTFAAEISSGKVKIFPKLLGAESRITGISASPEMLCLSGEDENGERCEMVSFDDWIEANQINKIDFIKMDIEGGEISAFQGAGKLIKKFKPKLAIAVYHEYENAMKVRDLILKYRTDYKIRFSGIWDYKDVKPRPYMIYAY